MLMIVDFLRILIPFDLFLQNQVLLACSGIAVVTVQDTKRIEGTPGDFVFVSILLLILIAHSC